jgi:hypothetical protein
MSDDRTLELAPGDVVVVTVTGADAPAVALEANEDGSLSLLPAAGEGTPGPFVHQARARGEGTAPDATAPHS